MTLWCISFPNTGVALKPNTSKEYAPTLSLSYLSNSIRSGSVNIYYLPLVVFMLMSVVPMPMMVTVMVMAIRIYSTPKVSTSTTNASWCLIQIQAVVSDTTVSHVPPLLIVV